MHGGRKSSEGVAVVACFGLLLLLLLLLLLVSLSLVSTLCTASSRRAKAPFLALERLSHTSRWCGV